MNKELYEYITKKHEKPLMIMMIGLPGSGKSTFAESSIFENMIIHSSDKLREELYNNVNIQECNVEIFAELHKRLKDDLRKGNSVIYDATNISKKRRRAFISELKNISCEKICICMMTPYEICLINNSIRERVIPNDVIKKMYMHWCPPDLEEGFNKVFYEYNFGNSINVKEKYTISSLFAGDNSIFKFSQENSHHRLTLGKHCVEAKNYLCEKYPQEYLLHIAALLHDIGKVFTKTRINQKGLYDGNCHYYQHHCVGAYDSLFYTYDMSMNTEEKTYIANLIYYHMHPFTSWKDSEKAKRKCINQIGEKMYNDIMKLHEGDLYAH